MKTQILVSIISFLSFFAQAQEQRCGFAHTPNLVHEQIIKRLLAQETKSQLRTEEKTYTIPVLFHIIQTNNPNDDVNKLTSVQINEQIRILNNDYNRLNADTVNMQSIFKNVTGKILINFILAEYDTNRVSFMEKGIIRHKQFSSRNRFETEFDDEIKKKTIRNPNQYLNIWVYEYLLSSINGKSLLGYAQFPDFSNLAGLDNVGIVTKKMVIK